MAKVSLIYAIAVALLDTASAYACSATHWHQPLTRRARGAIISRSATPHMREMQTLTRSDEYLKIVEGDDAESIDVIKFVAPWCRLCKSVSLKLASTANKFPGASFYEVLMVKDTEPFRYFAEHEPEMKLPYVEVWAGRKGERERVDAMVVTPPRVPFVSRALMTAETRLGEAKRRRERRRLLVEQRQARDDLIRLAAERKRLKRRWRLRVLPGIVATYGKPGRRERRRHLLDTLQNMRQTKAATEALQRVKRRKRLYRLLLGPFKKSRP